MKIADITNIIEHKYPQELQEAWDSSGLLTSYDKEIKNVLVCLDVTPAISKYAIENEIDLIISHHPMIFMDYTSTFGYLRDTFQDLYAAKIALYSMHTNYDDHIEGMNELFVKKLGYQSYDRDSMFVSFDCDNDIYNKLENIVNDPIRIYNKKDDIHKGGVLLGAGGSFIDEAIKAECDIFISSEFKHHEILYAKEYGITLVDVVHQAEEIFIDDIATFLESKFSDISIHKYNDRYRIE